MLEKLDIYSCEGTDKNVTLITWPNQRVCPSLNVFLVYCLPTITPRLSA